MINPLLIAKKENAGILRNICAEIGATPRDMIGDEWSLEMFVKKSMKNYAYQSHYVLDVSAIKEKGDKFISLCESISLQNDYTKLVIWADEYQAGDEFLNKLVHSGVTNIVANYPDVSEKTNIKNMMEDLKECLSENGLSRTKWRRFDNTYDAMAEAREAARLAEIEREKPKYSAADINIAVVGAQSRIGTTTYALRLAEYFRSRDGQSVVVCASKRSAAQLDVLSDYFDGIENEGVVNIHGVDVCPQSVDTKKSYNATIYDFGNTDTSKLDFKGFDVIFLVGGASWNELPMVYEAQEALNSVNYTVCVNFSTQKAIDMCHEYLAVNLNDVILLPYEPDPFSVGLYEEMFDSKFVQWSDSRNRQDENEDDYEFEK